MIQLISQNTTKELPIFLDQTGHRWNIAKFLIAITSIIILFYTIGVTRYYYDAYNYNNTIKSFNKEYSDTINNTSGSTHAFLSPDYTSSYLTGSIKENIRQIKRLIINPFSNGDNKLSQDGGLLTSIEFYTTNNKNPSSILINKDSIKKHGLETLIQTPEFNKLVKYANIDTVVIELDNEDTDNIQTIANKYQLKTAYLINPRSSKANFNNQQVYVNFNINYDRELKDQITDFNLILQQVSKTTTNYTINLPSGYYIAKDNKVEPIDMSQVQSQLKVGETIKLSKGQPVYQQGKDNIYMNGKWLYSLILNQLASTNPQLLQYSVNNLSNTESSSIEYINKYGSQPVISQEFALINNIKIQGQGLVQTVKTYGQKGKWTISQDQITIEQLPESPILELTGKEANTIALTFDDGPSLINTPKILDLLEKNNIKATFFVTGQQIIKHPQILKQIHQAGHQIENHTFSHPYISNISKQRLDWEITQTNQLIANTTGYQPKLLRVPYDVFGTPSTISDLLINKLAQTHNLKLYQIDSDAKDFTDTNNIEPESRINLNQLNQIGTQILFHDGPDVDRSKSYIKLEETINKLKQSKFKFVTVNYYDSTSTSQKLITTNSNSWDSVFVLSSSAVDSIVYRYNDLINIILLVGSYTVVMFIIFLFRNRYLSNNQDFLAPVTAIIPCYNEEINVINTVNSLLNNDTPNLKIIVVDDGSKDTSYIKLKRAFHSNPRVTVLAKPNGGKSTALNYGLRFVDTEFFVTMDSDTIFAKDSVRLMLRPFVDPEVAAVAGNVQLGNEFFNLRGAGIKQSFFKDFNWLTTCQRFEYITGQNFEKLAFNGMGCVIVVPGAIGCFRTKDVIKVGSYKEDTLAEDTNLTIELLKLGKKVRYEPNAVCYTEAPDSLKQFYKQRFRWSFGTFQVAWKNKHLLFNPKYGSLTLFALPYMVFGLINLVLLPLTSVGVLFFMFRFISNYSFFDQLDPTERASYIRVLVIFILFTIVSLMRILYSIYKDKSHSKYQIILIYPIIVTVYNLLLSWITIRAFFACIKGQKQGWGHLVRKGTVSMDQLNAIN
jgi:cellulose synthase/poly-beta-1,6-N-acetylglucosamine synthase-like glycosyltransferase/peptidoglycan/xylan/chitin deacetylase (PgdA/CDA1 family)